VSDQQWSRPASAPVLVWPTYAPRRPNGTYVGQASVGFPIANSRKRSLLSALVKFETSVAVPPGGNTIHRWLSAGLRSTASSIGGVTCGRGVNRPHPSHRQCCPSRVPVSLVCGQPLHLADLCTITFLKLAGSSSHRAISRTYDFASSMSRCRYCILNADATSTTGISRASGISRARSSRFVFS